MDSLDILKPPSLKDPKHSSMTGSEYENFIQNLFNLVVNDHQIVREK